MLLKFGIDGMGKGNPLGWLYLISGLIVLAAGVGGIFRYFMRMTVIGISRYVESDIRESYFTRLLGLAPLFFDKNHTGDLMARATEDVERVRMVLGPALLYSVSTVLTLLFSGAMMFYLDAKLTSLVFLLAPVVAVAVLSVATSLHRANLKQQEAYGELTSHVQENLSGIRVIKAFAREDNELGRFTEACRLYFNRSMGVARIQAVFMPLLGLIIGIGVIGILWIGGKRVVTGEFTLGSFIAFMSYLGIMTWPMIALGWVTHIFQRGSASFKRLNKIYDVPLQFPEDGFLAQEFRLAEFAGNKLGSKIPVKPVDHQAEISPEFTDLHAPSISFRDIQFKYRDDEPFIFSDLNLNITAGSTVAVVGRTGSGKSTLVRILTRLYDPQSGLIRIDGKLWTEYSVGQLRYLIGYVDQTPFMFSTTIRENITFGKKDVSDKEITAVSKAACLDKDVADFPDGYNTVIGERGVTLSGGQQQRLTLARALLLDPPILILDDALSAVDTETELEILNGISDRLKGRTTIFITHRLAAAEKADRVVVIEDGKVAEEGSHADLMKLDGIYSAMYRRQRISDELGALK